MVWFLSYLSNFFIDVNKKPNNLTRNPVLNEPDVSPINSLQVGDAHCKENVISQCLNVVPSQVQNLSRGFDSRWNGILVSIHTFSRFLAVLPHTYAVRGTFGSSQPKQANQAGSQSCQQECRSESHRIMFVARISWSVSKCFSTFFCKKNIHRL